MIPLARLSLSIKDSSFFFLGGGGGNTSRARRKTPVPARLPSVSRHIQTVDVLRYAGTPVVTWRQSFLGISPVM